MSEMELIINKEREQDDEISETEETVKMLKKIDEISDEERLIVGKIKKTLEEHDLRYSYADNHPRHVGFELQDDGKVCLIQILVHDDRVSTRISYPFKVQTNAYPLMCMYINGNDYVPPFFSLFVEPDNGDLALEYTYLYNKLAFFDEQFWWNNFATLVCLAFKLYEKLENLSAGIMEKIDKKLYKKLFEMAIKTLDGGYDGVETYGIRKLKFQLLPALSELIEMYGELENYDDMQDEEDDEDTIEWDLEKLEAIEAISKFIE